MKNSSIGWTEHTWNPVTGCTQISPGCDNCYALSIAERFRGGAAYPNGFDVTLKRNKLNEPYKWKSDSMVFVNSMSDLFHKDIPKPYLEEIWQVMTSTNHTYQILTKRPHVAKQRISELNLPLQNNIWLGVSVENQTFADNRIPTLLDICPKVAFISAEPLLDEVDLSSYLSYLDWVIVGGESGNKRRTMNYDWARKIRDDCNEYGVSFFYKQGNHRKSGMDNILDGVKYEEYPFDINK